MADSYIKIPLGLEEQHLEFLDDLREGGSINMYGAGPELIKAYPDLDRHQATKIVTYWMQTFKERQEKNNGL